MSGRRTRSSRPAGEDVHMSGAQDDVNEDIQRTMEHSQLRSPEAGSPATAATAPRQAGQSSRAPLKSKPRIIRRTAEQRAQSEREELERMQAKADAGGASKVSTGSATAKEPASQSGPARQASSRPRASDAIPQGPFSMGSMKISPSSKKRSRGALEASRGATANEGGHQPPDSVSKGPTKSTTQPKSKKPAFKKEPSQERDGLNNSRIDIQSISLLSSSDSLSGSDSEDGTLVGDPQFFDGNEPSIEEIHTAARIYRESRAEQRAESSEPRLLDPVRVGRREHIERPVAVNTTLSAGSGASGRANNTKDRLISISDAEEQPNETSSARRSEPQPIKAEPNTSRKKPTSRSRLRKSIFSPLPSHATEEEQAEHSIRAKDRSFLVNKMKIKRGSHSTNPFDNDSDSDIGKSSSRHFSSGPVIFQFPPVIPDLYDPQAPGAVPSTIPTNEAQNASTEAGPKVEDELMEDVGQSPPTPEMLPPKNPPGFAGTLSLHRSGRMRLSWGGFACEVSRGAPLAFRQDLVLAVPNEGKPENGTGGPQTQKAKTGIALALGSVQENLVVSPDVEMLLSVASKPAA